MNTKKNKYLTFQKSKILWDIRKESKKIWEHLCKKDKTALDKIIELEMFEKIPICKKLKVFKNKNLVRPNGSSRAYYIKLKSGGVLAIKGTEVFNSNLKNLFKEDSNNKLKNRPWSKFENFVYREQKIPLAFTVYEGMQENDLSMKFQKKMLENFKSFEMAPVPLFIYEIDRSTTKKYYHKIKPFLNDRSKKLTNIYLNEFKLGVGVYYYPHIPERVRFMQNKNNQLKPISKKIKTSKKLIEIISKMLISNYFPFSFKDHGIGQCIAPQNVTLEGGITDMGSLHNFKEVKTNKEFIQLFYCSIIILIQTIKEILIYPKPDIKYEFDNPSMNSVMLSTFVWDELRTLYFQNKKIVKKFDKRLEKIFLKKNFSKLGQILDELY